MLSILAVIRFTNMRTVKPAREDQLWGPVLMAEWSKALPLTASCLSPLP